MIDPQLGAFRHEPGRSTLLAQPVAGIDWSIEPAICGYRHLEYRNESLGRTIPVPISATPAVVQGVGAIVASDDGFVRLFDERLNRMYWERRIDSSVYASVVADHARNRVIVAGTGGTLASFDLRGRRMWTVSCGHGICATPVILRGSSIVVVAAFESRCIGFNAGTGEQVFSVALPAPWHAVRGGSAAHRDPYASPVALPDGNLVLCCAEGVLCLGPTGTELWSHDFGPSLKASPVAVHTTGEVMVAGVDGRCRFLDAETGAVRGEVRLGAKITASPALSGGVVAVGTICDETFGLDVTTHSVIWHATQGGPREYTSLTVAPDGNFLATNARRNIICLARDDGAFVWESSQLLGLPDHDPGVDITPIASPDGNLYCASYSGDVYRFCVPTGEERSG